MHFAFCSSHLSLVTVKSLRSSPRHQNCSLTSSFCQQNTLHALLNIKHFEKVDLSTYTRISQQSIEDMKDSLSDLFARPLWQQQSQWWTKGLGRKESKTFAPAQASEVRSQGKPSKQHLYMYHPKGPLKAIKRGSFKTMNRIPFVK